MRKNVAQLTKELQKINEIIKFYKDGLDELEYAYSINFYISDDIRYKHQDLILNYINQRDELQSELNSIKNKHE